MSDDTMEAIKERSQELVDEYSQALTAFVNQLVPMTLTNAEYAARTSALLIALNRELARCAAAFGEAHEIDPHAVADLVALQFTKNHAICLDAIQGEGQTKQ